MSQNLAISETGLKLIKAFEGYRPVDRELVTGQRIVGYGHRLYSEDAVMMDKGEAEEVLRSDLEPFEEMINTEVHAPMTQSQFDALCSFAFNIGPRAFLTSDTLRALNNGRPLDAANGLDVWRKSEIAGKTYVVDALMRRRTAEKALFLRTPRDLPAGREDLPPVKDTTIEGLSTEDALPVFTEEDARAIVASAPYSATNFPARRREDGVAGTLQLSEIAPLEQDNFPQDDDVEETSLLEDALTTDLDDDESLDVSDIAETAAAEAEAEEDPFDGVESVEVEFGRKVQEFEAAEVELVARRQSPIAAAASDIVARLDRLIDDVDTGLKENEVDWSETSVPTDRAEKKLSESKTVMEEMISEPVREVESQAKVIDLKSRAPRLTERFDDKAAEPKTETSVAKPNMKKPIMVIDELAADDVYGSRRDSASKYIENSRPEVELLPLNSSSPLGLWIPVVLGFVLLGAAGGTLLRGAEALLGAWGPIIAFTGFAIGIVMILAGIYAALRINAQK